MTTTRAFAKINLALVAGPLRADGKHEVATVLQRVSLHDELALEPAGSLEVAGFADDTLVRAALEAVASAGGVEPRWRVRIDKRIPVAAGLGGGSSDAAAALRLANEQLDEPLPSLEMHRLAAGIGADVPFFLAEGSQLGTGDGTELRPLGLPRDYMVLLVLPDRETKASTASVYARFDERGGAAGFRTRREQLLAELEAIASPRDLARLPANDLASSPLVTRIVDLGAFRADVSGAGPTVYGLFDDESAAEDARDELAGLGTTWLVGPI